MIENVSTQLTVFHCLCPLPASRKGLASLYALLFLEKEAEIGGRDIVGWVCKRSYQGYVHGKALYELGQHV